MKDVEQAGADVIGNQDVESAERTRGASLVQPLFDGPLDIVGDIHGEIAALHSLLQHLGYHATGEHAAGRRLVFLGDLTDRGPDSPAVVRTIQSLVEAGRAQCVLGNHDLNLLLGDKKHDNHWFFGEEWALDASDVPTPAVLADDTIRGDVLQFFRTLPLALERDDLRVVHACWNDLMIELARNATATLELYSRFADRIAADHAHRPDLDHIAQELEHQNRNPVKLLTSGPERRAATPFHSSGRLRYEERVPWWESYDDEPRCVFGHYARLFDQQVPAGRAICIDFGVGKRWSERRQPDFNGRFRARLAALRLPENTLHFDDGQVLSLPLGR